MAAKKQDVRGRLVAAAAKTIYEGGYANTTLATVASAAGVPLGNVYYYFKTKESLADAVIDSHLERIKARLEQAGALERPIDRILAFLEGMAGVSDKIARHGCPYGSLAQELEKDRGRLAKHARELIALQLRWFEAQFAALGVAGPGSRALELLCALQGAALVAHALGDQQVLRDRAAELATWVLSLARSADEQVARLLEKDS